MPIISLNLEQPEKRSGMFGDPTTPLTAVAVWNELDGGPTASGEIVTERGAMAISTVFTCVTILAEAVASLRCKLIRQVGKGQEAATGHYLYDLLAFSPNPDMTSFTFWSTMVGCSALHGSGYAEITRDPDGTPNGLWPLHPLKTEPVRQKDGSLAFRTTDGMKADTYRIIPSANILHFPLFALDGIKGIGPIRAARETFALAKAQELYGARWFGNGAHAEAVFIKKDSKPDPKVQAELKESWQQAYGGANQGKQAFLFGDWSVEKIGLSPEDSQFVVSRGFQRTEIAAMFHLQPHQVGDTSRLSNANHTQAQLSFVTDTLRPIIVRIEQELKRKLLAKSRDLFVEFDLSERLRGDFATIIPAYAMCVDRGIMNPNEVRIELGMNPAGEEGDVYRYPVNQANADQLLKDNTLIPTTQEPDPSDDPQPLKKPKK